MRSLRILYATDFMPHGRSDNGGGKMIHEYMRPARDLGHEISLLSLCWPRDAEAIDAVRSEWRNVEIVPVRDTRARRIRSFVGSLFQMEGQAYCRSTGLDRIARRFLAAVEFDVIHAVHPWLVDSISRALPKRESRITRLVGHVFDVQTDVVRRRLRRFPSARLLKEYAWARLTEFRSYARCDRLLAHWQGHIDRIAGALGGGPPARVIPVWFDAVHRIVPEIGSKPQSAKFIVVGTSADSRMRESIAWLLDSVWPGVLESRPDATLHLHSVVPEHIARWASVPGVVPHTYTDDIVAAYDGACALLFPLKTGGYGWHLKVLNAMARGCPIILSSEANTAEQLVDGEEAFVRDDGPGFRDAMLRLCDSPEQAAALARRALKRVTTTYAHLSLERELDGLYSP